MPPAPPPTKHKAPNQPGIVDDVHPMTDPEHKECNAIMDAVYAAREGPRLIATDFHALPDRKRYPDYYEAIPKPVCLDEVENKLDNKAFSSAQAFVVDLQLVFQNAMHYNEDDSSIWKDAKRLDDLVTDLYASAEEDGILPPKEPFEVSSTDGPSTSTAPPALAVASGGRRPSAAPASPAPGAAAAPVHPPVLTLAMLPKKRGRPTKEEAAARAAAGYVKKPARVKNKPAAAPAPASAGSPAPSGAATPSAGAAAAAAAAAKEVKEAKVDVSIPWETYIPPSPSKMSEPALSDQEETTVNYLAAVTSLEERLPRAEGFEVDAGWLAEGNTEQLQAVLEKLKTFVDANGRRYGESLEDVPTPTENRLLSFQGPMSFDLIESQLAAGSYATPEAFDKDMVRLFEKARRWHPEGSAAYGEVLVLQRYYQDLTSERPGSTTAATAFSSLPGGPGNARRPMFPGSADTVATFRIAAKDRSYVDVGVHKGTSFVPGDYVHVHNADEPAKPIIGQVFKVFKPTKGPFEGQTSVSVCWYFRPEGTIHPASRLFFEGEILKTGYFGDHVLADVLEKVGAQFYSRAIRGRPKGPHWYPGWPLYVVESRYNPKDRQMIKIKNWASCIPEELRKTDFMPIAPFSGTIALPKRLSPFLRGVTGPGCLGYPETRKKGGGDEDSTDGEGRSEAGGEDGATPARLAKRLKKDPGAGGGKLPALGGSAAAGAGASAMPSGSATPSVLAGVNAGAYSSQRPSPALSRRPSAAPPGPMAAPSSLPPYGAGRPQQHQQQQAQASGSRLPVNVQGYAPNQAPPKKVLDRSVVGNSGGPLWVSKTASQTVVPPVVAARFPSDPATGSLLWFSGPPMHVAPSTKPAHSPAYLAHLASLTSSSSSVLNPIDTDAEMTSSDAAAPPSALAAHELDPAVSGAMADLVRPDFVGVAQEVFAYEFEGLEESDEWQAVMRV